jgi:hypothetical protein
MGMINITKILLHPFRFQIKIFYLWSYFISRGKKDKTHNNKITSLKEEVD